MNTQHSVVMSSNNMVGSIPDSIQHLTQLRMIELATMPQLGGHLSAALCSLTNLRRLCICRCAIVGTIPAEIGNLKLLEELQLFGNLLTGEVPDSLRQLTSLRLLVAFAHCICFVSTIMKCSILFDLAKSLGEYTGGNNFTPASLPSCLSCLTNLEALFMSNCHLNGWCNS